MVLISEVKSATNWYKRDRIMSIIYEFVGHDLEDKKAVLFSLKVFISRCRINWVAIIQFTFPGSQS